MDHYAVLGVSPTADSDEIRQAYLAAARHSHPDFHVEDAVARHAAEDRMRRLNLAWEELSDPVRRARYDAVRRGDAAGPQPGHRPPAGRTTDPPWRPYDDSPAEGFDERHDRPITSGGIPEWLRLAPVISFLAGITFIILGGFTGLLPVVALGLASLVASFALFVIAPLVALTSSRRGSSPQDRR